MNKKLELTVENLNPIKKAKISLGKINIIGGVNSSGKSTLSKMLFCFLTSISEEGEHISNQNVKNVFSRFINYWSRVNISDSDNAITFKDSKLNDELFRILSHWDNTTVSYDYFMEQYEKLKEIIYQSELSGDKSCISDLEEIRDTIKNYKDDASSCIRVNNTLLRSEYDFSQLNSPQNVIINLKGINNNCEFNQAIKFKNNSFTTELNENFRNCLNFREICYLDSPGIFDINMASDGYQRFTDRKRPFHYDYLYYCLTHSKITVFDEVFDKKMEKIENEFKNLLQGEFEYYPQEEKFIFHNKGNHLEMKNTASGYKQIGIIQLLLKNRMLSKNSF